MEGIIGVGKYTGTALTVLLMPQYSQSLTGSLAQREPLVSSTGTRLTISGWQDEGYPVSLKKQGLELVDSVC